MKTEWRWDPRYWGITARLVVVATVPAALMLLAVNVVLYISGKDAARQTVSDRGQLIADALAWTAVYGVASGNVAYLERLLPAVLHGDSSVVNIEILDRERRVLLSGNPSRKIEASVVVERPVVSEVLEINFFNSSTAPHADPGAVGVVSENSRGGVTKGFVRVWMSPEPVWEDQLRKLYLLSGVVTLAALGSAGAGLFFAHILREPLRAILCALQDVRSGHFDVQFGKRVTGDLGKVQSGILEMARDLRTAKTELETLVISRTRELRAALERACIADEENRRLIAKNNEILEDERRRISGELHDELGSLLIVVRLKAQHVAGLAADSPSLVNGAPSDTVLLMADQALRQIERLGDEITETTLKLYSTTRRIVHQLRPELLDTLGLQGAVRDLIQTLDDASPDCRFVLEDRDVPEVRPAAAIALFRLIQEALSNVVKHASATGAGVKLVGSPDHSALSVEVWDNGVGFDPSKLRHEGIGLIGMRHRVSAMGGVLTVESKPEKGSRILVALPLT